jgi:hypothetical protein
MQSRAARAGASQGADASAFEAAERLAALRGEGGPAATQTVGELLFAVVALARDLGVEPEDALREASARFEADWLEREPR